jgi:hypothetical protein
VSPVAKLTNASEPAGFASGVALSSDGTTALVGDLEGADVFRVGRADSWRDSSRPTASLVADRAGRGSDRRPRGPGRRRLRRFRCALPERDDRARRRSQPGIRPCRSRLPLLGSLSLRLDVDRESRCGGRPEGVRQRSRLVGLAVRSRDGSRGGA